MTCRTAPFYSCHQNHWDLRFKHITEKILWKKKPNPRAEESENSHWKKSLVSLYTVSQSSTIKPVLTPIHGSNFLPTD